MTKHLCFLLLLLINSCDISIKKEETFYKDGSLKEQYRYNFKGELLSYSYHSFYGEKTFEVLFKNDKPDSFWGHPFGESFIEIENPSCDVESDMYKLTTTLACPKTLTVKMLAKDKEVEVKQLSENKFRYLDLSKNQRKMHLIYVQYFFNSEIVYETDSEYRIFLIDEL